MKGTKIEHASDIELSLIAGLLIIVQVLSSLAAYSLVPYERTNENILGVPCEDHANGNTDPLFGQWYYRSGKNACQLVDLDNLTTHNVVYIFEAPFPRVNNILEFTKWNQYITASLAVYQRDTLKPNRIFLDGRLGGRNNYDADDAWEYMGTTLLAYRDLTNSIKYYKTGFSIASDIIPLFDLDTINYDHYLLNVRLSNEYGDVYDDDVQLVLQLTYQNEKFIILSINKRLTFFIVTVVIIIAYCTRVIMSSRSIVKMDYIMLSLGMTMLIINLPLEYLTYYYDIPYMILLTDLRQNIFYFGLFFFWVLFISQHIIEDKWNVMARLRDAGVIFMICALSFVLQLIDYFLHSFNPFANVWNGTFGIAMPLAIAGIITGSAVIYLIAMFCFICKAFCSINKHKVALPKDTGCAGKLSNSVLKRYKVVMIITLICAILTVLDYILREVNNFFLLIYLLVFIRLNMLIDKCKNFAVVKSSNKIE